MEYNPLTVGIAFSPRASRSSRMSVRVPQRRRLRVHRRQRRHQLGEGVIGDGVQSVSIAFDPQGNEVADVVYQNGEYYEFDASGKSTLIASNVVSASVAIDSKGDKLQDYVTADGVAHEISTPAAPAGGTAPAPTTTTLGTNVVSISVAFDGNGGIARSVLFTNGLAYQYDYAGQHLQGQVFNPFLYNPNRLSLKAGLYSY